MPSKPKLDRVTSSNFLDEIHHLLWVEPGDNRGTWDEGWSCRDHALLSGIVCQLLKMTATVIHGKAMYVQGPENGQPPFGLHQEIHAWLGIDGLGFMDLSVNLAQCRNEALRAWPLRYIAMNRCVLQGSFQLATTQGDYEQRLASATHSSGRTAIYYGLEMDAIDSKFVEQAFEFINSPLSDRLSASYDPVIYAKAAIHLFKLANGENQSLRNISQAEAWETISKYPGNPLNWLRMRSGIR